MKNILRVKNGDKKFGVQCKEKEDLFNGDCNQVLARHIVLNEIKNVDCTGIGYATNNCVHAVIIGTDIVALHLARQLALICHYPNFNDELEKNRTKITIISPNISSRDDIDNVQRCLEEITGNLLSECVWQCKLITSGKEEIWSCSKEKSFIDIEFEFVGLNKVGIDTYFRDYFKSSDEDIVSVLDNDNTMSPQMQSYMVEHYYQYQSIDMAVIREKINDCKIDVRRAKVLNMVYCTGSHLKNLILSDVYEIFAYKTFIDIFCRYTKSNKVEAYWDNIVDKTVRLSNVLCADTLESKLRSISMCKRLSKTKMLDSKSLEQMARSEHARWCVEKLILGYRTYTSQERYNDELLFVDKNVMNEERNRLKEIEHAHIDICSCRNMLRNNPENLKYDCFLVLAVEEIISRVPCP